MEDLKDVSIHHTTEILTAELQNMKSYKTFYENLQVRDCILIFL